MLLLPDELKRRLPPLFAQEAEADPMVYARFYLPGTTCSWYVLEGEPSGRDLLLTCFFSSEEKQTFGQFGLSALESIRGPQDQLLMRDESFPEGRLTDVVPAPDV